MLLFWTEIRDRGSGEPDRMRFGLLVGLKGGMKDSGSKRGVVYPTE